MKTLFTLAIGFLVARGLVVPGTLAQSAPQLLDAHVVEGTLRLSWVGTSSTYEIQLATNLVTPNWRPILTTASTNESIALVQEYGFIRIVGLGPAIDEGRRLEILESVRLKVASLSAQDPEAANAQLATFLSQYVELRDISVSEDASVWCEFTDGRLLTILNNRSSSENPPPSGAAQPLRLPMTRGVRMPAPTSGFSKRQITIGVTPVGIPDSNRTYLFSHSAGIQNAADELDGWLSGNGYQVVYRGEPTIEALAAVQNAGILYFEGHSTARPVASGKRTFTMVTANTTEQPLPARFQPDVGYAILAPRPNHIYYTITDSFIRKYMTLSPRSFVFLNSCSSFDPDMVVAFWRSTYAGWTFPVSNPDGWRTARFLFDRLLGANKDLQYPESPFQRPFGYGPIQADMRSRSPRIDESFPFASLKLSHLLFSTAGNAEFGILAPSIESMSVDERTEELQIRGIFDPTAPAEVTVYGATGFAFQSVTPVSAREIRCPLPISGNPSAGNVVVSQRGHESNLVPLSEWRIRGQLVGYFSIDQPEPSITYDFNVHFRADVHSLRRAPHQPSAFLGTAAQAARDSTCRLVGASGTYHDPNGIRTVEWRTDGSRDLPWMFDAPGAGSTAFYGKLSIAADGALYLIVSARAKDSLTMIERTISSVTGLPVESSTVTDGFTRAFSGSGKNGTLNLTTYAIPASQGSTGGDSGRITWETAEAIFPPDRTTEGYAE